MDREILLRQLVQVEQGVAEGKAFIAEQQRLIVESERDDCHDTAETMRLLEAFLVLQRSREEDRARILDEANRPYVRFGSKADLMATSADVRLVPEADISTGQVIPCSSPHRKSDRRPSCRRQFSVAACLSPVAATSR